MLGHFLHDKLHLVEGHRIPTGHLHENGTRLVEKFSPIEERALERLLQRLVGAVVAFRHPVAEETAGIVRIEGGEKIVHADPDDARAENHVHRRPDALADDLVRGGEGLGDTVLRNDEFAHSVVVESDDGVGITRDLLQRATSLPHAALPFKRERHRREHDQEDPFFPRDAADFGRCTGSGAPAEAHADENHFAAADGLADFIDGLDRRLLAEGRISARTHALEERGPELDLLARNRSRQRANIRVQGQQLGVVTALERHPVENVRSGTTDADHFDAEFRGVGKFALLRLVVFYHGVHLSLVDRLGLSII